MRKGSVGFLFLSRRGLFCLFAFLLALSLGAQTFERGTLIGTVFADEGKTPVAGAVLKLRNITSGSVYESPPTDAKGFFRLENIGKGIYQYGLTTAEGDFNSNELIGIIANETTRISVSLSMYDTAVQSGVQEILRAQADREGETRIGRVLRYNPATKTAEVFIEMGLLQRGDRIRVKGATTNFYQNADSLAQDGSAVRRIYAGQNGLLGVARNVEIGDGLYIVCEGGVPFFLTPCGIATVVAGTGLILSTVKEITDKTPVSPIK
ncbi:MAG: carboxypeptidase regulatory-like domain-containing protein [Candidatus Aminicenantes bacterium]|nr:carboxypeptidase regulatory-like domain-containing protein [Candidatus Aminicenantes bacterium]MBM3310295.1 carboxypeptidase regulatory-like domain-containing protein [Candidatus Aminicenantes bacterium]